MAYVNDILSLLGKRDQYVNGPTNHHTDITSWSYTRTNINITDKEIVLRILCSDDDRSGGMFGCKKEDGA